MFFYNMDFNWPDTTNEKTVLSLSYCFSLEPLVSGQEAITI